jgi:hypothetical protein
MLGRARLGLARPGGAGLGKAGYGATYQANRLIGGLSF